MKFFYILLSLASATSAHAMFPLRAGGDLGIWGGNFSESFAGSSTSIKVRTDFAAGGMIGFPYHQFFADLVAHVGVGRTDSAKQEAGDATYFSPIGVEVGFSGLQLESILPLEAYVGIEYGKLNFITGTETDLGGPAMKVGVNLLPFHFGKYHHVGLKLEWRKHWLDIDNNGSIPVETSFSSFYAGVTYLFDSRTTPDAVEAPQPASSETVAP